jgi:hypothetical protein
LKDPTWDANTRDYIASLRDDLKRAADLLGQHGTHSAVCLCECCHLGCSDAIENHDGDHVDACERGQFIKRIETT